MVRLFTLFILLATGISLAEDKPAPEPESESTRHRLIILADMGNEPDEEQQMAHMLVNSNEFDLEGLIAVTGKYLNEHSKHEDKRRVRPDLFHKLINAYAKVEPNLRLHAKGWHEAQYLRSIVRRGQEKYGLADTGPGKSSPGSKLIVQSLRSNDPRPLNIVVNAGSNTLAQALIDLKEEVSPRAFNVMVRKLRVFENGAQDNCGAWICHQFPAVHWIRSNHQTYGYMGQSKDPKAAAGPHVWKPHPKTHQGQHRWAEIHIMNDHGPLGAAYPYRFKGNGFLEGGGTIPWLGLVNTGLYNIDQPSWGGWSGRFTKTKQKNVWSRHASVSKDEKTYGDFALFTETSDRWQDPADGKIYDNNYAPVWRWRQAQLHNCQARFDWCVKDFKSANHHPVARVGTIGTVNVDDFIEVTALRGAKFSIDASRSDDPDGDNLNFHWYFYTDVCTNPQNLPTIEKPHLNRCDFQLPPDAKPGQIHLILEVTDDHETVPLTDYRRIIINVK